MPTGYAFFEHNLTAAPHDFRGVVRIAGGPDGGTAADYMLRCESRRRTTARATIEVWN